MASGNAQQNNNVGYYGSAKVVPRAKQIRRINNDYEYLSGAKEVSSNASNDEIFKRGYEKKGLQPQTLGRVDGKRSIKAANDDLYSEEGEEETQRIGLSKIAQQLAAKKSAALVKKNLFRARASAVNTSVFAWGGSLWFFVQLPFAILSIAMLGIAAAVGQLIEDTGFIGGAVAWLASKAAEGINLVFGVDFSAVADGLFAMFYMIVFAIGIITILGAYFQYSLSFLKPLSGEQAGLKLGALLLALIGYCLPLLNLFPWILIWMAVVWKYPR